MIENLMPSAPLLALAPNITAVICTAESASAVAPATVALGCASGDVWPLTLPTFTDGERDGDHSCLLAPGPTVADVSEQLGCSASADVLLTVRDQALECVRTALTTRGTADEVRENRASSRPRPTVMQPASFESLLASLEASLATPAPGTGS